MHQLYEMHTDHRDIVSESLPLLCSGLYPTTCVCGSPPCQVFQSKDAPDKSTTPEEFIRMTKGITIATAKAVAAGNSAQQEDVIATANLSRKAIYDMLSTCKVLILPHTHSHTLSHITRLPGNM